MSLALVRARQARPDTGLVLGIAVVTLLVAVFAAIMADLLWRGAGRLSWAFVTEMPRNGGRAGGIAPILVSTGLILFICMTTAGLTALVTASVLAFFAPPRGWAVRSARVCLDVLAAMPSIIFGAFGNVFFCKVLGLGFSILSGGLTLACMALPFMVRAMEEALRAVPQEYAHGGYALGLARRRVLVSIVIPAALPGLITATLLGVGRAAAETAVLLFTSGYSDRMPSSIMDSGRAITLHIYDLSMNVAGGNASAAASAVVLLALIFLINGAVLWLSRIWR